MTAMDMQELRELEEKMAANLRAGATPSGQGSGTVAQAPVAAVKKLQTGPVQVANPEKQEKEKHYGGEFYPVERPDDQKPDDASH
jgi:hypothetical protein